MLPPPLIVQEGQKEQSTKQLLIPKIINTTTNTNNMNEPNEGAEQPFNTTNTNKLSGILKLIGQRYQSILDAWTPHGRARWILATLLLLLFIIRILFVQGWYIVTYALGIYHLNLFIAFLTPKIDPALDFDEDDTLGSLPTRSNTEFRPFLRRLPEFKFWLGIVKSTLIGLFCTLFDCFNVPVFWPILVMYFITLLCITMKRQIRHMIKYKYLPFTHSKPKYQQQQNQQ